MPAISSACFPEGCEETPDRVIERSARAGDHARARGRVERAAPGGYEALRAGSDVELVVRSGTCDSIAARNVRFGRDGDSARARVKDGCSIERGLEME